MTNDEREFLLTEYQASWETIQHIDDRRGKFLSSYIVIFVASLSVASALARADEQLPFAARVGIPAILIATALAGIAIMFVLRSERKANVRYRKRVNRIRTIFLAGTEDGQLKSYMSVEGKHDPRGTGSTLKWIFRMLGAMVLSLVAISIYTLMVYP